MSATIGIDFGTTNSVISVSQADGTVQTAMFKTPDRTSETFRSVLCFWQENRALKIAGGAAAIAAYLDDPAESRFIQSIKTYLGLDSFRETRLFGTRFELEDLIARLIKIMWAEGARALDLDPDPSRYNIVAGRPVKFAGLDPDEALAQERLATAYRRAGFANVSFAYEPEGAAFWFAQTARPHTKLLVADFGGGTSDFSLVELTPTANGLLGLNPIDHHGIGIAGDMLDFRIIDHLIAPHLGKGDQYFSSDKWFDMPTSYYRLFSAWHTLSMMKTPKLIGEIQTIARTAKHPERLESLLDLIEGEMGYALYQAVNQTKATLSSIDQTMFEFHQGPVNLSLPITRHDFEGWIKDDIARIKQTILDLLARNTVSADQIDHVFMTGGTSFVPAIRTLLTSLFGQEKIASGREFTSVSAGLALLAQRRYSAAA
jgi:hypothetical chaperone protein